MSCCCEKNSCEGTKENHIGLKRECNTCFFYISTVTRRNYNRIDSLVSDHGSWLDIGMVLVLFSLIGLMIYSPLLTPLFLITYPNFAKPLLIEKQMILFVLFPWLRT